MSYPQTLNRQYQLRQPIVYNTGGVVDPCAQTQTQYQLPQSYMIPSQYSNNIAQNIILRGVGPNPTRAQRNRTSFYDATAGEGSSGNSNDSGSSFSLRTLWDGLIDIPISFMENVRDREVDAYKAVVGTTLNATESILKTEAAVVEEVKETLVGPDEASEEDPDQPGEDDPPEPIAPGEYYMLQQQPQLQFLGNSSQAQCSQCQQIPQVGYTQAPQTVVGYECQPQVHYQTVQYEECQPQCQNYETQQCETQCYPVQLQQCEESCQQYEYQQPVLSYSQVPVAQTCNTCNTCNNGQNQAFVNAQCQSCNDGGSSALNNGGASSDGRPAPIVASDISS